MPLTIPNLASANFAAQAAPDSGDIDIILAGFKRTGVLSGCDVSAATTMHVAVDSGTAEIAAVPVTVSANAALTIATSDATNPRWDLVYVLAAGTPTVTTGTPAANPVYPVLPANSVILAAVYVPANVTTILGTHITAKDVELNPYPNPSGWIIYGGIAGAIASASANVTAWDTAVTAVPAAGGTIFVRAGAYWINGNLAIARSDVKVLGEPGACFKLLGGSATNVSTTGTNVNMMVLGNLGGTPTCTDITIAGLEFDGNCVLQDVSDAPTSTTSLLTRVIYDNQITSLTNVTNAVITVTGAGMVVNEHLGKMFSVMSGAAYGDYKVISANTATTITLTGVFGTPPSPADYFRIVDAQFQRALVSATNTTNAILTGPATAVWGTTRYVGYYVNFITGAAAGVSKLITAHTNTTITVSGTYASPPAVGSVFQISTQPRPGATSWEALGVGAITAWDCYRVTLKNNYIHDMFGAGIGSLRSGAVSVIDNTVDNTGLQFILGPGNGISTLGTSDNTHDYPARQVVIQGNIVTRVGDVGIDIHGSGTYGVLCVGNTVWGATTGLGGSNFHGGILVEIETADVAPNIGTTINGNNIDGLSSGISLTNSGNNSQYFAAVDIVGNVITNVASAIFVEGAHINLSGNTMWMVGSGINSNAATAIGASVERDWEISNNTVLLDVRRQAAFGPAACYLNWAALAPGATIGTVTSSATTSGQFPIVLTLSGGWTGTGQPALGSIIVVAGAVGDTAANGAWVVQAVTGTTVTLAQSTSNGTWSSGGTITVVGHVLDSLNITGNTFQGMGSTLGGNSHSGIYLNAASSGTSNASIQHVLIANNLIHGFNNGLFIGSAAANALISGVEIRNNRIWNSNAWAIQLSGTQIRGTVIEDNNLADNNLSGAITGMTTGAYSNTSTVDVIRNNRGHNPKGLLTLPYGRIVSTPITTTVYTNDTGYDCMVYILGTITVISVGGQTTGLIASTTVGASIRVPVGQTLAITGSASLSWKWFGD